MDLLQGAEPQNSESEDTSSNGISIESDGRVEQVKSYRTPRQERIGKAIKDHAVVITGGQVDVQPVLEFMRDEYDDDSLEKAYIWQILGEFFRVWTEPEMDAETVNKLKMEYWRKGYRDGHKDGSNQ